MSATGSTTDRAPAQLRSGLLELRRIVPKNLLVWVVGAVGAANLLLLLAQAPALVHALYLNADNASALVLPALAGHAPPGSVVTLGNYPYYEPWWWMRLTSGLPGYRQLWEAAPFLVAFAGIAVIAAGARWALGRLAALLTCVALLCASDAMRDILFVPATRVSSVVHFGVLCGTLLFVAHRARAGTLSWRLLLAVGVPVVVFTAAGVTDELFAVTGIAAYVLTPLLCWLRDRSRVTLTVFAFAAATALLALLGGDLLVVVMKGEHITHAPLQIAFVASAVIISNLQNLIEAFASLAGGDFFGQPVSGTYLLTFALGGLSLVSLLAVLRSLWRWMSTRPTATTPSSARDFYIAFWGLVLLVVLAAFVFTSVTGNVADSRYLLGAWVAVAALLGTIAARPAARAAVIVALCVFGVLTVRAHVAEGISGGPAPGQQTAGLIEHFALSHGATFGYGVYWDSAPLTWETDLRLRVYPIGSCPDSAGWCGYFNNNISSWYTARPDVRTILVTDSNPVEASGLVAAPPQFGKPIATATYGTVYVYVYNHDIASDFGVGP